MLRVRVVGTGTESVFTQAGLGAGLAAAIEEAGCGSAVLCGSCQGKGCKEICAMLVCVQCWASPPPERLELHRPQEEEQGARVASE